MRSTGELTEAANTLGREFVVQVTGKVEERSSKNSNLPTGDIEVIADTFSILNRSEVPLSLSKTTQTVAMTSA